MAEPPPTADADADAEALSQPANPTRRFGKLPRRIATGAVVVLALYTLLGFVVLPWALRSQAIGYVRDHYGRPLTLEAVRVHPFKLYLELQHLRFPDTDGQPLIALTRAHVDFEALASLWSQSYVFGTIHVEGPSARAVMRADGSLNLADLAPKHAAPEPAQKPEPNGPPPSVWIRSLTVHDGSFEYVDAHRPQPFRQRVAPVAFKLANFRTSPEGGLFKLEADTERHGHVAWYGDFHLTPEVRSNGQLRVRDLPLDAIADYLRDVLPFELLAGRAGLTGAYEVRLGKATQVELRLPELRVDGTSLRARSGDPVAVEVASVVVREVRAMLHARSVAVGQVELNGLRTQLVRERDGSLNVARLGPRAAQAAPSTPAQPATPWDVEVARVTLADASIDLTDRTVEPAAHVTLAPVDLELGHAGSDLARAVSLTLDAKLGGGAGRMHASGYVIPKPLAAEIDLTLSDLKVALAQPYLRQVADLTLSDGVLSMRGKTSVRAPDGRPRVSAALDLSLRDLRAHEGESGRELLHCRELAVDDLRYVAQPPSLDIARVRLREPYAHVVLHEDQTLNLTRLLKPRSAPKPLGDPAITPIAPLASSDPEPPMRVHVRETQVDDMRLSFTDRFVRPSFSAELSRLRGGVRDVSSDPGARAAVRLDGQLGSSAPVSIAGSLQPFALEDQSDLRLAWKNITLSQFNPYSGRFTGYNVRTGELSTDIHYALRNGSLDATHKLRIDQLYWGDHASTTQAEATLPVKLATALLRDRRGVIQLDLPVQGKLADPSFRLGPIVWQVLRNVIVKAASAPFHLLGSLFRGAEKAQFVAFEPGAIEPSDSARGELAQLAKALHERPEVIVEVPTGAVTELDRPALADRKVREQLAALQRRELRGARKTTAWASLDVSDRIDLLETLYERITGDDPDLPDAPDAPASLSFFQRRAFRRDFEATTLERLVRSAMPVEPAELETLGQRRGEAIERALTERGAIALDRVLLSRAEKVSPERGKVRYELTVR
ncbi:MAG: DUF748 domain-containing protein [Polyangiales bacterium]